MKIAECENTKSSSSALLSKELIAAPIRLEQLHQNSLLVKSESKSHSNSIKNISQNVAIAAAATTATSTVSEAAASKMTDERHNNNNINNNNFNSNNERAIADATKILLKNGINGSNAVAFLTAASLLPSVPSANSLNFNNLLPAPPPAHSSTISATTTVSSNNGISNLDTTVVGNKHNSGKSAIGSTSTISSACNTVRISGTATPPTAHTHASTSSGSNTTKNNEMGVLDYTVAHSNNSTKNSALSHKYFGSNNNSQLGGTDEFGRHPMTSATASTSTSNVGGGSYGGGRLQFFKGIFQLY